MDPARSGIGGGIVATIVLFIFLSLTDLLIGGSDPFVFATFLDVCRVWGPGCAPGSALATYISEFWFFLVFAIGWSLLFAGFTWGLPGESGFTHGLVFGLILWSGYAIGAIYNIGLGGQTVSAEVPLLIVTLAGYLLYGLVLGGTYDYLAGHRTFMSQETAGSDTHR